MSSNSNIINNRQKFEKAIKVGKLISVTGLTQISVQLIGFVSGLLILRLLPTQEYALYTIANTMLGTMIVLADGGIASGVMARGGKVWKDRSKLGAVLSTGIDLRRKFAVASILVSVPLISFLLNKHNASWLLISLIVLSLIPAFYMSLTGTLYEIASKLQQDILPLQKVQVKVNVGRLMLLTLTMFLFPFASIALLAYGIPQIFANRRLRKNSEKYVDWTQKANDTERSEILNIVKRTLPVSIYYCVSGQLTIWIISLFGSTSSLAQIGALGRLSMLFSVFSVMFATLVVPRFARMSYIRTTVVKFFIRIQLMLYLLGGGLVIVFYLASDFFLWILGAKFAGFHLEVLYIAILGSVNLLSSSTNQLLSSRGLVVPPQIFISIAILVQIIFLFTVQVNEVIGVLQYGIYTAGAIYLIRLSYFFIKIKSNESYN